MISIQAKKEGAENSAPSFLSVVGVCVDGFHESSGVVESIGCRHTAPEK
jgi:hypothetical protein